jgi:hypothetical protein
VLEKEEVIMMQTVSKSQYLNTLPPDPPEPWPPRPDEDEDE